jgi:hypothetical protein
VNVHRIIGVKPGMKAWADEPDEIRQNNQGEPEAEKAGGVACTGPPEAGV